MAKAVTWQRIEGLLVVASSLALFWHVDAAMSWWAAALWFFAPDLSFAAYLFGPKVGAFCYNAVHVYALGIAVIAIGLIAPAPICAALGTLWLAHSGFDRVLGYGLKSPEHFSDTHLGKIGRER